VYLERVFGSPRDPRACTGAVELAESPAEPADAEAMGRRHPGEATAGFS